MKEDLKFFSANTTALSCKTNGLRGIYNAGATCYQNVVLQSFLHNPLLRNYYLSDGHHSGQCVVPSCLSCAMDSTFQDFYAVENTNGYTAASILSSFWFSDRKAFSNLVTTREQDAHEFFQFLAEELHERNGTTPGNAALSASGSNGDLNNGRPRSSHVPQPPAQSTTGSEHSCGCIIHQTFYGKLQRATTCQHCHGVTNAVESFLDLSLGFDHVPKKGKKAAAAAGGKSAGGGQTGAAPLSLKDCLDDEYIKPTQCEYRCHKCNTTRQARRNTSIKLLPNVLSIQLKVRIWSPSPIPHFLSDRNHRTNDAKLICPIEI